MHHAWLAYPKARPPRLCQNALQAPAGGNSSVCGLPGRLCLVGTCTRYGSKRRASKARYRRPFHACVYAHALGLHSLARCRSYVGACVSLVQSSCWYSTVHSPGAAPLAWTPMLGSTGCRCTHHFAVLPVLLLVLLVSRIRIGLVLRHPPTTQPTTPV